uniref:Glycosyl transferase n=1 Tax=uncultured marine thaumarchaeote KM3_60_F11 TaxID=1456212 RepID=A0A075HDB8_9ARCH|nr:glycosyl transferase [uncultured marine thaumarchaeote KM3_60_F11]
MKLLIAVDRKRFFLIDQFADELRKKGIECLVIDDLDIYDKDEPGNKYLKWIGTPKKFQKIMNNFKPDIIFTERVSHFSSLVIKTDIPLIIFVRGEDGLPHDWSKIKWKEQTLETSFSDKINIFTKQKIAKKCYEKATLILPICQYLEKIIRSNCPNKDVHVLYQGINQKDWFPEKGMKLKHPCVGFLQGAEIWEKTKEMLLLPDIMKKMPEVNFYWAGDGPYQKKILSILEKFDNFHWLGNLDYPGEVRQFLSEIDVYGLLTGIDMSPHTLLEAGLMKKSAIATNVGGVSESCIDNKTCFLIEKNDPQGWIDKISVLLKHKEKMKLMGNEGFGYVNRNFLWGKIAEDFIKILESKKMI